MRKPDETEEILARLMPSALSENTADALEKALDELAARDFPQVAEISAAATPATPAEFAKNFRWLAGAAAAALALLGGGLLWTERQPRQARVSAAAEPAEVFLLGGSERVAAVSDEGWRERPDGSAMHAVRMEVVGENDVLDAATGIVVRVLQPREEWLYTPVSSF